MSIDVFASGANRSAKPHVYASGANRQVKEVWIFSGGANRRVFLFFSASISPANINTTATPSSAATCTPVGGSGSYTYSWARISGSTKVGVNSPSSASTTFSRVGTYAQGEINSATFRCTVTDTVSGATALADISVTLERPVGGGGQ